MVGRLDDLAVVLDQDQRVAQVAEVPQRPEQPGVVARVEADRRLVEHVEHAGQPAADLAGQADPLALAAGERGRAAGEREVVEPDVDQERQPVADLADQVAGDVLLVGGELQPLEEGQRLAQRPAADLVEGVAVEPDGRRVVAQPGPHARGAGDVVDHPLELPAVDERDPRGLLDRREEPLVLEREPRQPGLLVGRHGVPGLARAVEDDPAVPAVQVVERGVQVDPLGLGQGGDHPGEQGVVVESGPDGHGPVAEAPPGVGDEHRRVGPVLRAQALADRAPAERAVEREVVRRELLEAPPAAVARAVLAVAVDVPLGLVRLVAHPRDVEHPLAQVERRLDRVGQPRAGRPADDRPVDHDLDPVLAAMAQLGGIVEVDRLAVDPHPREPRGAELVPEAPRSPRCRAAPPGP